MKRLKQVLDIGPKYSEQFERNGIRTVRDLARWDDLPNLSVRTEIPLELLQPWHALALQKLKASRYRRRIALSIAFIAVAALAYESRSLFQSPDASAQGNALLDQGHYLEAIKLYDKAIKLNPNSAIAYGNKGLSLRLLGRDAEAGVALDKAIELNPDFVWAYNQRGVVYSDEENYAQAIANHDKALELDPNDKFAYEKAFDLRKLGRYNEALEALNKGISIDPQWQWAYDQRSDLYHDNLFQYEQAYQDSKKASELNGGPAFDTDLAEAELTVDHFQDAYLLARKLLADNEHTDPGTFTVSERCAMRLVAIAALLLQGNTAQGKEELKEFVAYFKTAEPALHRSWDYTGTQHYIANRSFDETSKRVLLDMIGLLQERPTRTLQQFEPSVQALR